ncbi:MAG TPA: hydrogenase nickel incorporation protein HypB [Thermodesulfobacteriota bacterium]|nr:hydrogenase nickel incorporation protein HypB [Thermodesulfobacteriota bacterium]
MKIIRPKGPEIFDIELEKDLLAKNRGLAKENRKRFDRSKILAVDIMGSIGSGKTSLIKAILKKLGMGKKVAVIAGDLTTTIDAERIEAEGARVIQVNTGKECHLDAHLIRQAIDRMKLDGVDVLFIENVGNLICPGEFPLGAHKRLVVTSVTEGPYTIVKHPFIFKEADVIVLNKIDLARPMKVNVSQLERDARQINPQASFIKTHALSGKGIPRIIEALGLKA